MKDKQLAYVEARRAPKTETALGSLIMQHWQTRYLYGKALVLTSSPESFAKAAHKRWSSLMQASQQERSRTADADTLLRLTHAITRMQQMIIAPSPPEEYPAAHFWCIRPDQLHQVELPRTCRTIYAIEALSPDLQDRLVTLLPAHSLVVDLAGHTWKGLSSKALLDAKVDEAWQELVTFLEGVGISTEQLATQHTDIDAIDDALDILLDVGSSFLRHARHFQEALHLAQPLSSSHTTKQQYAIANLLARRVASLTPGLLHHSFIQAENDSFSLYDALPQKLSRESLTAAVARHIKAGRHTLARALESAFLNNSLAL